MALSIKANQAIGFVDDRDCNCGGVYCQPVQTDDTFMVQGSVTVSTNSDKVYNDDFDSATGWDLEGAWAISGGKLVGTNITPGDKAQTDITVYALELQAGRTYRIDTQVTVVSAGSAGAGEGWIIAINDEFLPLPSTTLGDGYNQSLTASWYYTPTSITSDVLYFTVNEGTIDIEVEYVHVYEVSSVGVQFIDGSGAVAEDYPDAAFVDYYPIDSVPGFPIPVLMEATLDFSTLAAVGCYDLLFYDSLLSEVNRVKNGDFDIGLIWWTAGDNWSWDATEKAHYQPDFVTAGQLSQSVNLIGGVQYLLQFTLTFLGLGNEMRVFVDTGSGSVLLGTFSGNGQKEVFIDLTAFSGITTITIYFAGGIVEHEYMLDGVSILANEPAGALTSNCINLKDTHDCTLLFEASNSDDAFGFDYTNGNFTQKLRVKAKMDVIGYPEEKEEYRFSNNTRAILFAQSESEYDIKIGDAPEYIHRALSLFRLHDSFIIGSGNDRYIASSDYDLRGRKTSKLKQAVFNVKDRTGLASNYSC